MPRFLVASCLCLLIFLSTAAPIRSYTLQYTNASANVPVKWATDVSTGGAVITVALSSSLFAPPANVKAGSDVAGAVRRAITRWSEAGNVRFIETMSDLQSVSPASGGDGVSLISVADTSENRAAFSGSVAQGRARVFKNPQTGLITEADIVLNPAYRFSTDGSPGTVDLESTIAHEVGHLLGLGHSAVVGATMQPRQGESPLYTLPATSGRSLSDDDRAGMRALYGARVNIGEVSGTVRDAAGSPIFGAHVWAEEATTGKLLGANITLADGRYRIAGLPPGNYRLRVEAIDGLVRSTDIASGSLGYSALANAAPSFRTFESAGEVYVSSNSTVSRDISLPNAGAVALNPRYIGLVRDQFYFASFAVPLTPGTSAELLVAGENIASVSRGGISTNSPFITVDMADPNGFGQGPVTLDGQNTQGLRVKVFVRADAPAGDYSLRLRSNSGEVAYIPGALTIESTGTTPTPSEVQTEIRTWTLQGATYAYVRLTFPNSTYRVADRGQVTQSGSEFSANARIEQQTTTPAKPVTTALIYNLGNLAPGGYTFTFRDEGNTITSQPFTVSATASAENPIDKADYFAAQQYLDFLGREADAPGLAFWTAEITSCGADAACVDRKRTNTSGAFFLSEEFQMTGYYVYRLYRGALGRVPYHSEFVPDAGKVAAGIVVDNRLSPAQINANKQAFAVEFVGREEFLARYGTLSEERFVDTLFETTGAARTSAERQGLVDELRSGAGTLSERRARVVQKVVDGARAVAPAAGGVGVDQVFETSYGKAFYDLHFNRAFVLMQYFGYLRRDPDEGGYQFWLDKLNRFNGDFHQAEMVKAFVVSAEYRSRFGMP